VAQKASHHQRHPSVEPGIWMIRKVRTLRSAAIGASGGIDRRHWSIDALSGRAGRFRHGSPADSAGHQFETSAVAETRLKYQQAESSATTDYLTGLPNARSLFCIWITISAVQAQ